MLLLHLLQLSERDVGRILPVANNCGNIHVRFSTSFYFRKCKKIKNVKNVKKRDTNKKRKKTFFTSMIAIAADALGLMNDGRRRYIFPAFNATIGSA